MVEQCMTDLHTMTPPLAQRPVATVHLDPSDYYRLKESWAAIRASSEPGMGGFDPVDSLRRTGALMIAVQQVITTARTRDAREPGQAS